MIQKNKFANSVTKVNFAYTKIQHYGNRIESLKSDDRVGYFSHD